MSAIANALPIPSAAAPVRPLSLWRLYALRSGYLLLVLGLGATIWPGILDPAKHWALMSGVVVCMLGAMSALALLGLRYPLKMLPLLFFELAWKTIWMLRVALPLWLGHRLDAATAELAGECLIVVVFLIVIPWDHVFAEFAAKPGDPWR